MSRNNNSLADRVAGLSGGSDTSGRLSQRVREALREVRQGMDTQDEENGTERAKEIMANFNREQLSERTPDLKRFFIKDAPRLPEKDVLHRLVYEAYNQGKNTGMDDETATKFAVDGTKRFRDLHRVLSALKPTAFGEKPSPRWDGSVQDGMGVNRYMKEAFYPTLGSPELAGAKLISQDNARRAALHNRKYIAYTAANPGDVRDDITTRVDAMVEPPFSFDAANSEPLADESYQRSALMEKLKNARR